MKFLVVGGAGYVGSHFVWAAKDAGHQLVVMDNLERGHRHAIPQGVELYQADILNPNQIADILEQYKPETVLHYAAFALVGESVAYPDRYYRNNVEGTKNLLEAMVKASHKPDLVFSSTCAVFGSPKKLPISESDEKSPESPYGNSKLTCEFMIKDYAKAYGMRAYALRYFNACGAHSSGKIGEDHSPETHLIPNLFKAALNGEKVTIFGKDFPTRDGTCVRDYIHVSDLADSHLIAAKLLQEKPKGFFDAIHLGTGQGYSNLEILASAQKITGKTIPYAFGPRRAGDPAELYADNRKAKSELNFEPRHSSLDNILNTAWNWHHKNPEGFGS